MAVFEFYLSKTHPDYKALFQTPNKAISNNIIFASARHSYRNEPLGKNTISKMTGRISIKAELSERYTNHCFRASAVTSWLQRGVDAREICAITKHKDERSHSLYVSETTKAQKRERLKILSDTFQPQLAVQQEASGITRQIVPDPSAGPSSNLNPQSLLRNQFISLAQPYQDCTPHTADNGYLPLAWKNRKFRLEHKRFAAYPFGKPQKT